MSLIDDLPKAIRALKTIVDLYEPDNMTMQMYEREAREALQYLERFSAHGERQSQAMKLLESLTPGGSEFVNDPERCAEFVREARRADLEAIKHFAARGNGKEQSSPLRATLRWVDMTPDDGLVKRILSAYIDESTWNDNTAGLPPDNPLCKALNEAQAKRNAILKAALTAQESAKPEEKR